MKVCLISKYPPIEGGESAKAYWLAKALGGKEHEVHIVTNAWEVEREYRVQIETEDLDTAYQPPGVHVHNTDPFSEPGYIPYSKPYTEKIASLAVDVIREYDLQLIDSWYILPYAISGFLAKIITGKPQILRHAGSDMGRLLRSPFLQTLFVAIFKGVDRIVTYPSMREKFATFGVPETKIFYNRKVSVDTDAFNPEARPLKLSLYTDKEIKDIPIIAYMGKTGRAKGIYELIEAASRIKEDFILLFVCGGKDLEQFREVTKKSKMESKTIFLPFLPPWKIPSVIKLSTCVVIPERDFPVPQHTPILPREVMAVGRCLIVSEEIYSKRSSRDIKNGENVLVVDPKNIEQFQGVLERVIKYPDFAENLGQQAQIVSRKIERFEEYIKDTVCLYQDVLV